MATKKSRISKSQSRKKKVARKPAPRPTRRKSAKKKVTRRPAQEAKLAALRRKLGRERFEALKSLASGMLARNETPGAVNEALTREARAMDVDASELYWIMYTC